MEAPTSPTSPDSPEVDVLVQTLDRRRRQVETFLAAHRQRWQAAEEKLSARLGQLSHELAQSRAESQHADEAAVARSERLEEEARVVARLKEEFQKAVDRASAEQKQIAESIQERHADLDAKIAELVQRHSKVVDSEGKLCQKQESLALAQRRVEEDARQLEVQREQLEQRRTELDNLQSQIERDRAELNNLQAEIEQDRAELQKRQAEPEENQTQLPQHEPGLAARQEELEQRQAELEQERAACERRRAELEQDRAEFEQRRAEWEQAAAERPSSSVGDASSAALADADLEESRRRYEMAVDDLRELRAKNEELRKQLDDARASGRTPGGSPGETLDWEAQKRRLLAALESDFEEDNPEDVQERLKIEEVIETTNRVVAERDREIAELKELLSQQSGQVGTVAVGAAAFGEILDHDVIIQEERENLKRLQEQLQEKLRESEIELSIERAKIARHQAEIDEKARMLGQKKSAADSDTSPSDTPTRGRWLSRLGLTQDDS